MTNEQKMEKMNREAIKATIIKKAYEIDPSNPPAERLTGQMEKVKAIIERLGGTFTVTEDGKGGWTVSGEIPEKALIDIKNLADGGMAVDYHYNQENPQGADQAKEAFEEEL